jgi:glycine/D-amino acid oxidase-like deaminating enzyme
VTDVVVVGAGVFGLSVGLELTRRGRRVLFVSADVPGKAGASAAETRIARLAYGSDELLTQSAVDGLAAWRALEESSGRRLFLPVGVLHLLSNTGENAWEQESAAMLASLGARVQELDVADLSTRCPGIAAGDLAGGLLECDAGVLLGRVATVALHGMAEREGARTLLGTARPVDTGIEIGRERIDAPTVVWAVGADLPRAFPALRGIEARTHDTHFFAPAGELPRDRPAWLDHTAPAYGVDEPSGAIKVALDVDRAWQDAPDVAAGAATRRYVDLRFPRARLREVGRVRCSYLTTADDDFAVGRVPGSERHWVVGGDSGHGFKHALTWGREAAGAIIGESEPHPRFRLERLQDRSVGAA